MDKALQDIRAAVAKQPIGTTAQHTIEFQLPDTSYRLSKKLLDVAAAGRQVSIEQDVLGSLAFGFMHVRHDSIPKAYHGTFDWVFPPQPQPSLARSSATFHDWLVGGRGIYWVSGKAGSGKSTFMKFIVSQQRSATALDHWAGPQRCVSASFFFWSLGTELQKSQEGLLRSLLFEIFRQCPELSSNSYVQHWLESQDMMRTGCTMTWTLSQLQTALRDVTQHEISRKFCFFIDGLDEYEGDHGEIIVVLRDLASCPNIKICVSSRPWNIFEDGLGQDPDLKVCMQDLTREDISTYVRGTLQQHAYWPLFSVDSTRHDKLVEEITKKAQGVFLWVFLVTRSLFEGLTNGDALSALERRIRQLPTDLEQYFTHMLNSVDPFYHRQMANTFLVALHASSPFPLMLYSLMDDLAEEPDSVFKLPIKGMEKGDILLRHQQMRRRINGCCKGLLEISHDSRNLDLDANIYMAYRVDFLHRTVKDFLESGERAGFLYKHASKTHTNVAIFSGFVALVKKFPLRGPSDMDYLSDLIHDTFRRAYLAELQAKTSQVDILDEFEYTLKTISFSRRARGPWHHGCDGRPLFTFLEFAIVNGLELSVKDRLLKELEVDGPNTQDTLLNTVLAPPLYAGVHQPDLTGILSHLLTHRNEPVPDNLWEGYLVQCLYAFHSASEYRDVSATALRHRGRTIELLLCHGARPGIRATSQLTWRGDLMLPLWAQFLFRASSPRQASPGLEDEHCRIISAFLRAGVDPNEVNPGRGSSIWCLFCEDLFATLAFGPKPTVEPTIEKLELQARLLGLLVEFGADLEAVPNLRERILERFPQTRLSAPILGKIRNAAVKQNPAQVVKSQSILTQKRISRTWSKMGSLLLGNV